MTSGAKREEGWGHLGPRGRRGGVIWGQEGGGVGSSGGWRRVLTVCI